MYERDQLEFAISQYLDGTLPPLERNALERYLAEDEQAQQLLEEYRALDRLARSNVLPMPAVRWDRLADHLAQVVAREQPHVRPYSIEWVRWGSRIAVAASLLLAAGIGILATFWNEPTPQTPVTVVVSGPRGDTTHATALPAEQAEPIVASVTIGPPRATSDTDLLHVEEALARPTRIIVAAANDINTERRRTYQ